MPYCRTDQPHQPVLEVETHEQLSADEQAQACATSVCLVLAADWNTTPVTVTFDDAEQPPFVCDGRDGDAEAEEVVLPRPLQLHEGKPLIVHAVELALKSSFAAVEVLLCDAGEYEAAAREALAAFEGLPVCMLSAEQVDKARQQACNFEILNVGAGALQQARTLLEETIGAESALILDCVQPRLTPWHLAQLPMRLAQHPGCHLVTSWIYWLRRLPILISAAGFEAIEERGLTKPRINSPFRPLPTLNVQEVVFGEEKLHANESSCTIRDEFLDACELSALEAVRLARKLQQADADEADELTGELNEASTKLVKLASEVLERMDGALDEAQTDELSCADAFGVRNKCDFPLLNDRAHKGKLVYLDSAATTQRLDVALQAEADFNCHENANIYRGSYALSAESTKTFNAARAVLEQRIGAERRQLILTANTTTGINIAAQAWGLRNLSEGDLVVIAHSEHHSNMLPWRLVAQARGAQVVYLGLGPDARIDMAEYEQLLERKPRLVCIAQVSNVFGMVNPVEEMARMAHECGARIFVDAAQSLPHMAVNVDELGCDFLAFSGHKMYGPLGIGGLWVSTEAFDEMDPTMSGGGAISHVGEDSYYLRPAAIQYELGTPPIAQAVGLAAAAEHLDGLGMDAVHAHGSALCRYALAGLELLDGVTVWGEPGADDASGSLLSFNLEGVSSARIAADMGALQVCVRAGGQCALPLHASMGLDGSCRISFGIYNTAEDVEAAIVAVALSNKLASGRGFLKDAAH